MYYIVYPLLYLLSLLPWRILYFLGDCIYVLVYYVAGYRKEVVRSNLQIAFPDKSEQELLKIAKEFYHNFVDNFIETIKLLSISKAGLEKRFSSNAEVVNALYDTGKNVQLNCGHFFNLEFANLGGSISTLYPFVTVYMPLSNKTFDRIMLKLRTRFGAILVPTVGFRTKFHQHAKGRFALVLAADQNPGNPAQAYWTKFFGRYTPFVVGPEKSAILYNTAVVFANFYRVKRGYFELKFEVITTTPRELPAGKITQLFISKVEDAIRERPANYLWSHRRWKWEFDEEKYGRLKV